MKRHFEIYPIQKSPLVFTMPSRKMISTLKACLEFETKYPGRPYGPANIGSSLFGLYKRGFLGINTSSEKKLKPGSWYLTTKGSLFLLSISDKGTVPMESILFTDIHKANQSVTTFQAAMYDLKSTSPERRNK